MCIKRFISNINYIYECPLGVGALAGTSYKIDRNFTSRKLGFKEMSDAFSESVTGQIPPKTGLILSI